jgi:DNA-binding NarL/FixJ family response regulator
MTDLSPAAVTVKLRKYKKRKDAQLGPSDREKEVLELLAKGHKAAAIAFMLRINTDTVEMHITNVKRKLGAKTLAHLMILSLRAGAITL